MKPDGPVSNLLSRPGNDAPWWILPIVAFVLGATVAIAAMMPIAMTPDYQRGHRDGYSHGWNDAQVSAAKNDAVYYHKGLVQGHHETQQKQR